MNFKLNLILIPFTIPRTAFSYRPSCDTIILNYYISKPEKGVGQIRLPFLHYEGKSAALSLERLAVGALIHCRIGLMRTNGNAVQRTVRSGRTMVCALLHRAVDGLVAAIVTHRE